MVSIRTEDEEKREIDSLIESAKWNMYAERWAAARLELEKAMNLAVSSHNKAKIDEILTLRGKCDRQERVEL